MSDSNGILFVSSDFERKFECKTFVTKREVRKTYILFLNLLHIDSEDSRLIGRGGITSLLTKRIGTQL